MLTNLVGNAIKFSNAAAWCSKCARPVVRRRGERGLQCAGHRNRYRAAQLGMIFDAFSQADASTSRRYEAPASGFSISRRLVGLMGGR